MAAHGVSGARHRLVWDRGEADVFSLGAMLHHVRFTLDDGRRVSPLAEAPWHDDPAIQNDEAIPAHLRQLGGEWACVPFGKSGVDAVTHGFGTDNLWQIAEASDKHVRLSIDYPDTHPIERLERSISVQDGRAEIAFSLTVFPRTDCAFGLGLHPVFALPEAPEPIQIVGAYDEVQTFPTIFEQGMSKLAPARIATSLDALPLIDGTVTDFATLATGITEEAMQLIGADGKIIVRYPDRSFQATLAWDANALPDVLLWVSARGRNTQPWAGRFRGLGIEPMKLRFGPDGAPETAGAHVHSFVAGKAWTTRYTLSASMLETQK